MSILNIQKVQREGARLVVMLCGVSGCGKTKTALEIAAGMVNGDMGKVGFLDTENGRGKLYADDFSTPYLYGELRPPFSPARYVQAIDEFSKTGVEVLIIDSGSHEFEGLGGVQDIAEAGNPRLPNWNKAKGEHKKFMSALLASPMHIILCLRAREKAKPEKGPEGKIIYQDLGLQPITEKNVVFEATVSLMLHDQGTRQDPLKVPAALQGILGRGTGYITQADGKALRAWVDGAKQLDPEIEHHRGLLNMAAENGTAALQDAWGKLPAKVRKAIGPNGCPDDLKASAKAFDDQKAEASSTGPAEASQTVSALNQAAAAIAETPAPEPKADDAPVQAPVAEQKPAPAPAATSAADDDDF